MIKWSNNVFIIVVFNHCNEYVHFYFNFIYELSLTDTHSDYLYKQKTLCVFIIFKLKNFCTYKLSFVCADLTANAIKLKRNALLGGEVVLLSVHQGREVAPHVQENAVSQKVLLQRELIKA